MEDPGTRSKQENIHTKAVTIRVHVRICHKSNRDLADGIIDLSSTTGNSSTAETERPVYCSMVTQYSHI